MAIRLDGYADRQYPQISRGTSLRIPVTVNMNNNEPFDAEDYRLYFTMKTVRGDNNFHDDRAYIYKEFTQDLTHPEIINRFLIDLTSKDTYLPWGKYWFDLQLKNTISGAVVRLATFTTEIVEGPTNRTVNNDEGPGLMGSLIHSQLFELAPITVVIPLVADPPPHNVEKILALPSYIVTEGDEKHPTIHAWGPKIIREFHGEYRYGEPPFAYNWFQQFDNDFALHSLIEELPCTGFMMNGVVLQLMTNPEHEVWGRPRVQMMAHCIRQRSTVLELKRDAVVDVMSPAIPDGIYLPFSELDIRDWRPTNNVSYKYVINNSMDDNVLEGRKFLFEMDFNLPPNPGDPAVWLGKFTYWDERSEFYDVET